MIDDDRFPDGSTRTEGETLDMPEGLGAFSKGQVLGERYQILEMLGRGGMGEVWHALDLKLRVEVALKALRPEFFTSERRLELLRQEVRAAREVVSPNVCRIFDLIEIEGRELVSMEYVDGATLLGVLQERGPLDLKEAQDIASQFLAGLEAIHKVGLIHRDIKPENIMLTRAGRVVVMDFGLARQETEGGGSVSGTPAYMAPEQAAGQALDARADVYAAGVVLAEMVSPEGIKNLQSRQSVWEGVRSEPAKVPDTPWAPVIQRAVARDRERRQNSAHTLIRELEDVTLRVEGAEDLHPYPGLASFTEADAEYFFGREAEVERMWRKLEGPARLLAIAGPSGAGKTSFLRAGVTPSCPPGWALVRCTPGTAPVNALAEAFSAETAGDPEGVKLLLRFHDPEIAVEIVSRWRRRHDHGILIVDQFEELFTLNPIEVQRQVADLLERVVLEADTLVLVSLRDDFLFRCHQLEALHPALADLTMLGPPEGAALRRAIVQPAQKCGYRFEDDKLVEEMLAEVEGERGALPLLAFAAARLWEQRDRETGHLTREAYQDIGGVGGALAQHAESTIDQIGHERLPIVRELFRNLVTAEGTRAVREWYELLSVFGATQRDASEEVLRVLIDARLLTSYEVKEEDREPTRRVEIIHESLLANWPRLVRWQTQDADAVQLRDQLRQAARTWDEQGRSDDTLWTGAAYREFASWRERYPGGLTEIEDAFAVAMTSLATRRRRRRRIAVAAGFTVLLAVLAVVGTLWQRSVRETRRAEASKLLVLGNIAFEEERTKGLAYAIASLEQADTEEGRRLALKALWAGPPATVVESGVNVWSMAFSPDGSKLAAGFHDSSVRVYSRDLEPPVTLHDLEGKAIAFVTDFSPDGNHLVGFGVNAGPEFLMWETDGWTVERVFKIPDGRLLMGFFEKDGKSILSVGWDGEWFDSLRPPQELPGRWVIHRWPLAGGEPELLGSVGATYSPIAVPDRARHLLASGVKNEVHLYDLDAPGREPPRIIARHEDDFTTRSTIAFDPVKDRLAIGDSSGDVLVWPLDGDGREPELRLEGKPASLSTAFSPDGRLLAHATWIGAWLWDLHGPLGAEPVRLGRDHSTVPWVSFTPDGRWLAIAGGLGFSGVSIWPMESPYCRVLPGHEGGTEAGVFSPDGSRLFTQGFNDGTVLAWDLSGNVGSEPELFFQTATRSGGGGGLAMDPLGRFVIAGFAGEGIWKIPLTAGEPTRIENFAYRYPVLDPQGRFLAAHYYFNEMPPTLHIVDLETGQRWEIDPPGEGSVLSYMFDTSSRLIVPKGKVRSAWDPKTDSFEILYDDGTYVEPLPDGRMYVRDKDGRWLVDPKDGSRTEFAVFGESGYLTWDRTGTIVTRDGADGVVVVWSTNELEPHLLVGHEGQAGGGIVSPDGKWISTSGADNTIRLWPMPDLSRPGLHTLPHAELLAKLETLTNLRVVPSERSSTSYDVQPDPDAYRGWAEVPTW